WRVLVCHGERWATMMGSTILDSKSPGSAMIPSRAFFLITGLLLLMFVIWNLGPIDARQVLDGTTHDLTAALAAEDATGLDDIYTVLFANVDETRIKTLQLDDNESMSVRASWESVRRTIKKTADCEVRPDAYALNRFTGFLEGRLRIALPDWWRNFLLG